jgi:hypothetical protein
VGNVSADVAAIAVIDLWNRPTLSIYSILFFGSGVTVILQSILVLNLKHERARTRERRNSKNKSTHYLLPQHFLSIKTAWFQRQKCSRQPYYSLDNLLYIKAAWLQRGLMVLPRGLCPMHLHSFYSHIDTVLALQSAACK